MPDSAALQALIEADIEETLRAALRTKLEWMRDELGVSIGVVRDFGWDADGREDYADLMADRTVNTDGRKRGVFIEPLTFVQETAGSSEGTSGARFGDLVERIDYILVVVEECDSAEDGDGRTGYDRFFRKLRAISVAMRYDAELGLADSGVVWHGQIQLEEPPEVLPIGKDLDAYVAVLKLGFEIEVFCNE